MIHEARLRLAHVALWTRDLEAAAQFWKHYFDAEIGPRYESRNRPGFVSRFVRLPRANLAIELMEGPWVSSHPGEATGWAHLAFGLGSRGAVDEMAAVFEQGDLLRSGPRLTGDGHYEAVVETPDGTLIELVE